ncbi:hypothetical protein LXL04_007106 [Taraxacum kok-saghyz]
MDESMMTNDDDDDDSVKTPLPHTTIGAQTATDSFPCLNTRFPPERLIQTMALLNHEQRTCVKAIGCKHHNQPSYRTKRTKATKPKKNINNSTPTGTKTQQNIPTKPSKRCVHRLQNTKKAQAKQQPKTAKREHAKHQGKPREGQNSNRKPKAEKRS